MGTHNLIVVGRFSLDGEETFDAAVGPLSTRAPAAARKVGEYFAWDYKSKRGQGRFQYLPLLRSAHAAWDYVRDLHRPPAQRRQGPHLPLEAEAQAAVTAALRWRDAEIDLPFWAPACTCALKNQAASSTGHLFLTEEPAPLAPCFRHPEGQHE